MNVVSVTVDLYVSAWKPTPRHYLVILWEFK